METSLINRDLARWTKQHWYWCVILLFGIQVGLFYGLTRPLRVRSVYPSTPLVQVPAGSAGSLSSAWLALEDPMLFAAPSWKGVSGVAWLRKPEVELSFGREFPEPRYLGYGEARPLSTPGGPRSETLSSHHARPAPRALLPVVPAASPEPRSTLAFEGFGGRKPVAIPELPVQHHSDVVGRTAVQAAVDAGGEVISSRVISPSGSKGADADALSITRKLHFEPMPSFQEGVSEISWGKLIFEWHALDLNRTNAVRR